MLKAETAHTITTPVNLAQGVGALGWGVSYPEWAGSKVLTYQGSDGYSFAEVIMITGHHFGVIVMTNQGWGAVSNPISKVFNHLLESQLYGKPL